MRRLIFLLVPTVLAAQQVVAPTPEQVGSPRGKDYDGYNVVNSWETGWRFAAIGGDLAKYRSDVNYGNGVRLLGGSLAVNSKDGHGRWFDEILLNTLGLGNDPYESASLRVEKNGLYRYDLLWRLDAFYNPGLSIAAGQHLMDTERRMQDHELTISPQSWLKLHLGYGRNTQDGPALSTIQLFDDRGDEFPLFADVRRTENEYRLGADIDVAGFRLILMHRWDYYKEDTPYRLDGSTAGNNPADATTLRQFNRAEPYHGRSPGWFGNLTTTRKVWAVNARMTYVGGLRNFIQDETAAGTSRFGAQSRQVLVTGDARRPVAAGDFSLSFFPGRRFTVVNNTSAYSTRIDGNAAYTQFDNALRTGDVLYFNYLGIRTVANATDVNYRVSPWLGFYGGYHYSTRRIRTVESFALPPTPGTRDAFEQENRLQAGLAGIRLAPVKPLTINLDGEVGRADGPFTPLSERNYHLLGVRIQYRTRKLQLATAYRQNYNNNTVTLSSHSARARNYSANGAWTARSWLALDAGYTKLHLDTVSGLAFFAGLPRPSLETGLDSVYVSNIHAGNFGARFEIRRRVDVYAGYTITKDTGDGRSTAAGVGSVDPVSLVFLRVQTYPLTFQSPLARVSVKLHPKLRWNVGWQFYRYREEFGLFLEP